MRSEVASKLMEALKEHRKRGCISFSNLRKEGAMEKSINEWMVVKKVLTERRLDLKRLREASAVDQKVVHTYGEKISETTNTAKYDVRVLDKRIVEMQNADLAIESAIKQSNATTRLAIAVDVDSLLLPVE
jgi:hypothetical protein